MALQTDETSTGNFDVTGFIATPTQNVSDPEEIEIRNYVGYVAGILDVVATTSVSKLGLGWRPITSSDSGRYLPMYIDLVPHDENFTQPNYALLSNLSVTELVEGKRYYVYFVNPETPAAVPLFKDTATDDGIEVISTAYGSTNSVFRVKLRVFHTEWPTT
jgi:hypothetical protein